MEPKLKYAYDKAQGRHYLYVDLPADNPGPSRVVIAAWSKGADPTAFKWVEGSIGRVAANGCC